MIAGVTVFKHNLTSLFALVKLAFKYTPRGHGCGKLKRIKPLQYEALNTFKNPQL
jgi:hypothetical protein